jgi:hypothetical protein
MTSSGSIKWLKIAVLEKISGEFFVNRQNKSRSGAKNKEAGVIRDLDS